jgi:hypothetical protein
VERDSLQHPSTLTARLATFFHRHPGEWVDARRLLPIGGFAGWRSRLADCRREHHMVITNRQRRVRVDDHAITISEYRFEPARPPEQLPLAGVAASCRSDSSGGP